MNKVDEENRSLSTWYFSLAPHVVLVAFHPKFVFSQQKKIMAKKYSLHMYQKTSGIFYSQYSKKELEIQVLLLYKRNLQLDRVEKVSFLLAKNRRKLHQGTQVFLVDLVLFHFILRF